MFSQSSVNKAGPEIFACEAERRSVGGGECWYKDNSRGPARSVSIAKAALVVICCVLPVTWTNKYKPWIK
jgi:hypothetical protein